MAYPPGGVERAMKVQEVIVRALAGQLTWLQAADILGRSPRSIRRLRWRLEHYAARRGAAQRGVRRAASAGAIHIPLRKIDRGVQS